MAEYTWHADNSRIGGKKVRRDEVIDLDDYFAAEWAAVITPVAQVEPEASRLTKK